MCEVQAKGKGVQEVLLDLPLGLGLCLSNGFVQ